MFEPRTLAKMLDALDIVPGNRVLVVGAGQGYSAAVIARMGADVVALEEDPALAEAAARVLAAEGEGARLVQGALKVGAAAEGPFEAILVEGGVEHVPAALIAQLKPRAAALPACSFRELWVWYGSATRSMVR